MASKHPSLVQHRGDLSEVQGLMMRTAILSNDPDFFSIDQVKWTDDGNLRLNFQIRGGSVTSISSAIPITNDGYFLTARHCVEDEETITLMIMAQGESETDIYLAKVEPRLVWKNAPDEPIDLALIHAPLRPVQPFRLTDRDTPITKGQPVTSTGWSGLTDLNPFGGPAAGEIVDAFPVPYRASTASPWSIIWHSCPLHPGDSGGPLLDARGNLMGVNSEVFISLKGHLLETVRWPTSEDAPIHGYRAGAVAIDPSWVTGLIERDRQSQHWAKKHRATMIARHASPAHRRYSTPAP